MGKTKFIGESRADGTVANLTSELLVSLKNQLAAAIAERSRNQALAAEYQSNYDRRYNCGAFKQPCNNWLDRRNEANAVVSQMDQKVNDLNNQIKAETERLERQYALDLAAKTVDTQNKVNTDPALLALKTQAEKDAAAAKNKRLIIISIIVIIALAAIGFAIYKFKNK